MQNIGASNADDAFYRYKMPKLVCKIEGRGNGIKTNVVNNVDIAKALERPPEYVLKYFGCELGAQTNFDIKTGTSIVNGAHDNKKLSELLEGFIKKYVQCYSCGNPETQIKIKKDFIHLKCKACGHVSDVDMRHKLNTFILKNPPENKLKKEEIKLKKAEAERLKDAEALERREKREKKTDKDDKEKKTKKEKREKKKKNEADKEDDKDKEDENEEELMVHSDEDDVVWMTDVSAEAVQRRAREQLTAATAALVSVGNMDHSHKESHGKQVDAGALHRESGSGIEQAACRTAESKSFQFNALREVITNADDVYTAAAFLKGLSVEGGLAGKLQVLLQAICAESSDMRLSGILLQHAATLQACVSDATSQLALLIALEYFTGVHEPERLRELPLALKTLFDADVVTDDVILAWAGKVDAGKILHVPYETGTAVRNSVSQVLEWLDADDGDADDEEVEA